MDAERALAAAAAVAETALVLVGAVVATLLLTLPFVPTTDRLEIPLRADPDFLGDRPGDAELAQRIRELELARRVEVVLRGGGPRLVLEDPVEGGDVEATIERRLVGAGYQAAEAERLPVVRFEGVVRGEPRRLAWLLTIQTIVFGAAGLLLGRWRVGPETSPRRAGIPRAVVLGLLAGVAALAASGAISALLAAAGLPVSEQAWVQELLADPAVLARLAPWMVLAGPLSEELFFRGYVLRWVRRRAGVPAGLLVSSVLFAVVHFNLSGFLIYLAIGMVLGLVHERTRNLLAPVVGHVLLNALVLASGVWLPGPEAVPGAWWGPVVPLVLFFC